MATLVITLDVSDVDTMNTDPEDQATDIIEEWNDWASHNGQPSRGTVMSAEWVD